MRNRTFAAAFAAALIAAAPISANAGPINSYPAAATPLSGSETVIGTQSGSTVQITAASIAAIVTAATTTWTGVQTFPAPGASHGSVVLTPGTATGTPPNGSIWVTSTGLDFQAGGLTQQAVGSGANAWTGKQSFIASATGGAGVNLGAGVAPTSPVNGDLWTTSGGLFAQIGGSTVQFSTGGVAQTGSVIAGDCVKWNATNVIQDALVPCGGGSGSGVPGGPNGSIQFENGTSFAGTSNFTYTTPGSVPTITGPDGTTWTTGGITMPTGKVLNLGNNPYLYGGTTPVVGIIACAGGTFNLLMAGADPSICAHATAGAGDNNFIGTISGSSLTSGFGDNSLGSENLHLLTSGSYDDAFGFEAEHDLTTGNADVAFGHSALAQETTGTGDTAVGSSALSGEAGASDNIGVGTGAGSVIQTGSNDVCIGVGACGTLTTGNENIMVGIEGYGIVGGHGNVALGNFVTTLADQNDSITISDGDGDLFLQYLVANGYATLAQALRVTGYVKASTFLSITPTTVAGLATVDPSPASGDRAFVTDATACAFGSTLTGSSSTKCPVYYDGSAWRAG